MTFDLGVVGKKKGIQRKHMPLRMTFQWNLTYDARGSVTLEEDVAKSKRISNCDSVGFSENDGCPGYTPIPKDKQMSIFPLKKLSFSLQTLLLDG